MVHTATLAPSLTEKYGKITKCGKMRTFVASISSDTPFGDLFFGVFSITASSVPYEIYTNKRKLDCIRIHMLKGKMDRW